jgi:hypothetical protein
MRLVLSVGNRVLAMAPVDPQRSKDQDYLDAKRRLLKSIHRLSIAVLREDPVFYLQAPSKLNERKVR